MNRRQSVSKEEREKTPGIVYLHTWICGAGPILESIESDIHSNSTPSKEAEEAMKLTWRQKWERRGIYYPH